MKAVIAGSYEQYHHWLNETMTDPADAFYVSREAVLRGRQDFDEVIMYGTWYRRPDVQELRQTAEYLVRRARGR